MELRYFKFEIWEVNIRTTSWVQYLSVLNPQNILNVFILKVKTQEKEFLRGGDES